MNKIYEHRDDVHVVARLVYANPSDTKAYEDEAFTKAIDAVTLKDMFIKGCLIVDDGATYKPVSVNEEEGVVTINYVVDGETAVEIKSLTSV